MDQPALQGRALARLIDDLQALVVTGEVAVASQPRLTAPRDAGLWLEDGERLISTPDLVVLGNGLPQRSELLPALFSLISEVRHAWNRIVHARLREMGERGDVATLCESVSAAGALAAELLDGADPSMTATSYGELERAVLPAAAHEAQAFPVLLRALAATATLVNEPAAARTLLPKIVWDDPTTAWRPGRLLRPPSVETSLESSSVLSGGLDDLQGDGDAMRWALQRPWVFLLGQMVFTKEAWEAERVSGGLAFELEQAHVALFQSPPRVEVVVTLPSGEELRCGSLGELVMFTLADLGVTLFAHRASASQLDDLLATVIAALIRREIWRFDHGTGGRRPGYSIHPSFSDACYRALGSRAFYRLGGHVTVAIRRTAETWARERLARAGQAGAAQGGG